MAAALFVTAVLSTALGAVAGIYNSTEIDLRVALLYALCLTAPLAWRRRLPCTVAVAVSVAFFAGIAVCCAWGWDAFRVYLLLGWECTLRPS